MTTPDASVHPTLSVGLLECDHVAPHLRHVAGDYADMFRALFARHARDVDLVGYDVIGGRLPADPAEQDAWLITGSKHSVYEDLPWVHALLDFIRQVDAAGGVMVGICFGHQALAHALGGRTSRSERGWGVGIHPAEITQHRPWMEPDDREVRLLMTHQDQVVDVPERASVLGCSAHCEVSMFEIDGRMLGIQGHPEFSAAYASALLDERLDRIPHEVVAAARATLSGQTDESVVARWIAGFIGHAARGQPRPSRHLSRCDEGG